MKLHCRMMSATAFVALMLAALWVGAFANWALSRQREPTPSLERRDSNREPRVPSLDDSGYYVGSEIGKTYHKPDCFYVTKQLKHLVRFETKEAAEESGRHACTNCLTGARIARTGRQ